jgi:hypothetical protein
VAIRINHIGERFHLLTIVGFWGRDKHSYYWNCVCDCGNEAPKKKYADLKSGKVVACGCTKVQRIVQQSFRHGEAPRSGKSAEYKTYMDAKKRCQNPRTASYPLYGGRGIEFRFESIEQFISVLGRKPSPRHSIDRFPDQDGHYEPGNVRWANPEEQANNVRTNHRITVSGEEMTLKQAERKYGIGYSTVIPRLKRGWCSECAATLPTTAGMTCRHQTMGVSTN